MNDGRTNARNMARQINVIAQYPIDGDHPVGRLTNRVIMPTDHRTATQLRLSSIAIPHVRIL